MANEATRPTSAIPTKSRRVKSTWANNIILIFCSWFLLSRASEDLTTSSVSNLPKSAVDIDLRLQPKNSFYSADKSEVSTAISSSRVALKTTVSNQYNGPTSSLRIGLPIVVKQALIVVRMEVWSELLKQHIHPALCSLVGVLRSNGYGLWENNTHERIRLLLAKANSSLWTKINYISEPQKSFLTWMICM